MEIALLLPPRQGAGLAPRDDFSAGGRSMGLPRPSRAPTRGDGEASLWARTPWRGCAAGHRCWRYLGDPGARPRPRPRGPDRRCAGPAPRARTAREHDRTIPVPQIDVAAGGPRPQYEFEQILPGGDDPDASDPILEAIGLRDRGESARAVALLEGLAQWDPRCLDAHAHLGLLTFDDPCSRRATTRPASRSPSARSRRSSRGSWAGGGSITGRSYAACTA